MDLARHNTTGTYFIHVYSGNKLVATPPPRWPSLPTPDTVTAQVSDNCRPCLCSWTTTASYSSIRFAV